MSSDAIYDPQEASNRKVHEFNRKVDKIVFRPVSNGYGTVVHEDARLLVSNFSDHLSLPADIVNNLLQGDLKGAGANSFRLVFNTVFGLGGIGDPATAVHVPRRETDFGETFHVWGMKEGAYVELPLLGPSTERDTIGTILDFTLDPVSVILPRPEKYIGTVANVADRMGQRYELRGTIDSVLYESADSYAQARILYLQNRRFELGGSSEATYLDPYDDPYAE
ncbi:MlaA family lipoprotein [Cognatishimia sp. SS12]|uniref:MlaA family lipoprotein n=1 Tax=Cognatishimia sp. SS12 TaxID=2979465 RepID=UPI00232D7250|nr:VacJ family lipoprotein [Cognatishimia sp. SS12]